MKTGISYCDKDFGVYLKWLDYFGLGYEILDYRRNDYSKFDVCDGLILTGGVDIYPELYSDWETKSNINSYKPERDGFEMDLIDRALFRKIPVLGICRGCQLINVFFRGSLIQDLGLLRGNKHSKDGLGNARLHSINILDNTLLSQILNMNQGNVNSTHHQAIDRLGEGLAYNCKAEDGIIEGIEFTDYDDKSFLLGIQWHPERMDNPNNCFSSPIVKKLISEIKQVH